MKLYCFFNQFNEKLYNYSKRLLDLAAVIGCLVSIWVFGNTDYFGSRKPLSPQRVTATIHPNSKFEVLSTPLHHTKNIQRRFDYGFEFIQRAKGTLNSQIIITCLLLYLIYLTLLLVAKFVQKFTAFNPSKKDLQEFTKDSITKLTRFEDLVQKCDIVYQSTLASVMKGREVGCPRVTRINSQRLTNLNTSIQKTTKASFTQEWNQAKKAQKFITLSSYDYRVKKAKNRPKPALLAVFRHFFNNPFLAPSTF